MYVLYDTTTVHPLDRYEHVQAGAGTEMAPVAIRGRTPVDLVAVMSGAQIGDFAIRTVTWAAANSKSWRTGVWGSKIQVQVRVVGVTAHPTGGLGRAAGP
jgi:hypothetical protein